MLTTDELSSQIDSILDIFWKKNSILPNLSNTDSETVKKFLNIIDNTRPTEYIKSMIVLERPKSN
jgi:hypothetical protein